VCEPRWVFKSPLLAHLCYILALVMFDSISLHPTCMQSWIPFENPCISEARIHQVVSKLGYPLVAIASKPLTQPLPKHRADLERTRLHNVF